MIKHRTISLVGDDAETEETLCVMQSTEKIELPPQEAIKLSRQLIRDMKQNITRLEHDILWVTDRQAYVNRYERKNDSGRINRS